MRVRKSGAERTITNVAAGRVTSNSTDAINGSQLYTTNNMLTNVSETITTILGGNAEIEQHGNNLGKIRTYDIGGNRLKLWQVLVLIVVPMLLH